MSDYKVTIEVTREDDETYPLATLHGPYQGFAEEWAKWLVTQTAILFTPRIMETRVLGPRGRVEVGFGRESQEQARSGWKQDRDPDVAELQEQIDALQDELTHAHNVLSDYGAGKEGWSLAGRIDTLVQMLMTPDAVSRITQALQERGLTMSPAASGERTIEVDDDDVYERHDGTMRVTIMTRGRHGLHIVDADGADRLRREMYACAHNLTRILAEHGHFDEDGE